MNGRKVAAVVFAAAVTVLFTGCLDSFRYITVMEKEAGFEVDLPRRHAVLTKQTERIATEAGSLDMEFYLSYGRDKVFMVGVAPHGMPDIGEEFTFQALRFARDMLAMDTDVISRDEFYFNGRPAVSVRYKKKEKGQDIYAHAVITDVSGVQYQTQVASPLLAALDDPDAVRFHMSFRYTGQSQPRMNSLSSEVEVK